MAYESIDSLEENPKDLFVKVSSLLMRLVENVLRNPTEPKYRKIRLGNERISEVVIPSVGGMECLFDMGFVEADDSLYLPTSTSMDKLKNFQQALKSKIDLVMQHSEKGNTSVPITKTEPNTSQMKACESTQPVAPAAKAVSSNGSEMFLNSLETYSSRVCQYEDKQIQMEALSHVPLSRLQTATVEHVRAVQRSAIKENVLKLCEASIHEVIFLKKLMNWFKTEFFKWVNSPLCSSCNSSTRFNGYSTIPEELTNTRTVEVYLCNNCNKRELFPRYNDVRLLLQSRKGRCGEWAQCFTLFCRAFKWDARFVSDNNDHVWTEVYSSFQNRWLHCDPCECAVDKPLLYEKGWNKKPDYIIAFSCDGVYDVTWRYSADHKSTIARRSLMAESTLISHMTKLTQLRQQDFSERRKKYLSKRHIIELVEFLTPAKDDSGEKYEGRTSGSLAWRLARGEIVPNQASSEFVWKPSPDEISAGRMVIQYCPCMDEYVNESRKQTVKGWANGCFQVENIFRKEELDWKMVYLSRTEGSSKGILIWKFDVEQSGIVIDSVEITFLTATYKTGLIKLILCGTNKCVTVSQGNLYKTHDFSGETSVTLKAELCGGEGDVAWQHTQLFRVPAGHHDSKENYPFRISIILCDKNKNKC